MNLYKENRNQEKYFENLKKALEKLLVMKNFLLSINRILWKKIGQKRVKIYLVHLEKAITGPIPGMK